MQEQHIRSNDTHVSQQPASDSLLYSVSNANISTPPLRNSTITRFYLQSLSRTLLPNERVTDCLRKIVPGPQIVTVMHAPDSQSAHYKNLIVCSRIWICPVCASKITERRRQELQLAIAHSDYAVLLLTYTLRHSASDTLAELLNAVITGYGKMKAGDPWKRLKSAMGWIGDIRALEVTHGEHGWHPHIHVLTLVERQLDPEGLEKLENRLKRRWQRILARSGHNAEWKYGLDIRTARRDIAAYIAKYGRLPKKQTWTIEHELTKQPVKKAKSGGRTPMQMLVDYGDGDHEAGELFAEYATVFKGRHQLQWSRGLRKLLGLLDDAKSDEELAKEESANADILALLSKDQWRVVLGNDARAELLTVAASGDFQQLSDFCKALGIEELYQPQGWQQEEVS